MSVPDMNRSSTKGVDYVCTGHRRIAVFSTGHRTADANIRELSTAGSRSQYRTSRRQMAPYAMPVPDTA
eukprot:3939644-Rhodomonas_salina.1